MWSGISGRRRMGRDRERKGRVERKRKGADGMESQARRLAGSEIGRRAIPKVLGGGLDLDALPSLTTSTSATDSNRLATPLLVSNQVFSHPQSSFVLFSRGLNVDSLFVFAPRPALCCTRNHLVAQTPRRPRGKKQMHHSAALTSCRPARQLRIAD